MKTAAMVDGIYIHTNRKLCSQLLVLPATERYCLAVSPGLLIGAKVGLVIVLLLHGRTMLHMHIQQCMGMHSVIHMMYYITHSI